MTPSEVAAKLEQASAALKRYDLAGLAAACKLYAHLAMEPSVATNALAGWAEARAHLSWQRLLRGQAWEQEAADALGLAETALARESDNADCQRALAAALMTFQDQAERRRAAAVRAVELDPKNASNWYERWKAFGSSVGDGAIRRALELDPKHVAAVHDLGVALSEAGRHQPAVKLLQTAVELSPENTLARFNLSMVLGRAGREAESAAVLNDASRRAPDDPVLCDRPVNQLAQAMVRGWAVPT